MIGAGKVSITCTGAAVLRFGIRLWERHMDATKTATQAQMNTVFDYIHKYERYDMDISKLTAF